MVWLTWHSIRVIDLVAVYLTVYNNIDKVQSIKWLVNCLSDWSVTQWYKVIPWLCSAHHILCIIIATSEVVLIFTCHQRHCSWLKRCWTWNGHQSLCTKWSSEADIIIVPLLSFSDETRTMHAPFLLVFFTCYGYKEK